MDYTQVEEKFQSLKEQFKAGTLDEAAFKAQLNELMVQDGQGRWWMIGYETGQWYMHDGSAWVRSEPPGRGSYPPEEAPAEPTEPLAEPAEVQSAPEPAVEEPAPAEKQTETAQAEPIESLPEPVQAQAAPESVVQETAHEEQPPAGIPEAQAPVQMVEPPAVKAEVKEPNAPAAKPVGFITNRGREALLILLGAGGFALEGFFQSTHIFMLFGLIPSLSGIFFGPWVGGLTGVLGELIAFGVFSARGNGSYDPMPFVVFSGINGIISGLLVKDAKNWKSVLYACLLSRVPLFLGDVVGQTDNITESYFADWFVNRLVDFLMPGLLLVPLVARALVDMVKERGWYWPDTPAPRKGMHLDWHTILLFGGVWSVTWGLIYGLGLKLDDVSSSTLVYGGICGIASGLAGGLVLRRAFQAVRAGQILLMSAGWAIGFLVTAAAFANVVAFGNPYFEWVLLFIFMGFAGGIGMGVALKWAGVFSDWRQALLSSIPWGVGLIVCVYGSNVLSDQHIYRLFIAGLLVGSVGAWGIFWQSRPAGKSAEIR